ncbi:hypothetical protein P8C59_007809 [Phyllachora maydis]|uniref:Uncharacterized protein n=1 Tax=Phyllachora maydis TaxID=1825666 RepID=A0AAD9I9S8_9PEZI|nr:hypothetical protein P8C59_007809 [Phyllachora maydis]
MYIYIAFSPYCYYYCDSSFTNLLIANIDSLSDLDNLVYNILGISTAPLALVPTLAKPAKIMPAIRCIATRKAKQRELAKAYATAGRAVAAKRQGLQRSKRTTSSNTGRYTTNSGLTANKDDNNAYNRAYVPPTNIEEEEEGSSGNNNGVNSSTSDSTDKGKDSSAYKHSKSALRCKDILLYKRQP